MYPYLDFAYIQSEFVVLYTLFDIIYFTNGNNVDGAEYILMYFI